MRSPLSSNHASKGLYRLITLLIIAVSLGMSAAHATANQRILVKTSVDQLLAIAKSEGYAVSIDEDGDLLWKIEGYRTYLLISDDNEYVQFQSSFEDTDATLENVNAWNQTKRYSRTYLDDKGDPVLELDLDFEGGITRDRIISFLQTCRVSFQSWLSEVVN